jgi:hypothetical protein
MLTGAQAGFLKRFETNFIVISCKFIYTLISKYPPGALVYKSELTDVFICDK